MPAVKFFTCLNLERKFSFFKVTCIRRKLTASVDADVMASAGCDVRLAARSQDEIELNRAGVIPYGSIVSGGE